MTDDELKAIRTIYDRGYTVTAANDIPMLLDEIERLRKRDLIVDPSGRTSGWTIPESMLEQTADNNTLRQRIVALEAERDACRGMEIAAEMRGDRLYAENERLREKVDEALRLLATRVEAKRLDESQEEVERLREDLKKAQEKAAIYERDWYEAKSEFGTAIAKLKADIAQERLKWEATRRSMLQTRDDAVKQRDEVYDLLRSLGWESYLLQETAVEFIKRLLPQKTVDRRWDLP